MEEKKKYEAPEMKAYQVKAASIICTSGTPTGASFNEYEEEEITIPEF